MFCKRWIVLRNPWGYFEATASVLDDTISMYDVSWWRPITLKTSPVSARRTDRAEPMQTTPFLEQTSAALRGNDEGRYRNGRDGRVGKTLRGSSRSASLK